MPIMRMSSFAAHALSASAGAGVGAYIDDKNREQGTAIGGVVGLAGVTGYKLYKNYNRSFLKHMPGKGMIATVVATAGLLAYGAANTPNEYQRASVAKSNTEGTDYTPEVTYENYRYGLAERTASMNVSGDLVFGLHNLRHG